MYLSVGTSTRNEGVSPSDRFMKRFEGHRPPVRKRSECTIGIGTREAVRDRATGEIGLLVWVGQIKWVSKTEVEVPGKVHDGGLAAAGNPYRVAFEGGRWVVKEDLPHWIS